MTEVLPIYIIDKIERRWKCRLDTQPQAKRGKNDDRSAGLCPLCSAPASIKPASSDSAVTRREYVCNGCGHAWHNEAQ